MVSVQPRRTRDVLSMIRHIYPITKARARALGAWRRVGTGARDGTGHRRAFWSASGRGARFLGSTWSLARWLHRRRDRVAESVNAIRRGLIRGFFFAAVILGTATFACIQGELSGLRQWTGSFLVHWSVS